MKYNENYKKSVSDSIANAIALLEKTKTTAEGITTIPDDFEKQILMFQAQIHLAWQ